MCREALEVVNPFPRSRKGNVWLQGSGTVVAVGRDLCCSCPHAVLLLCFSVVAALPVPGERPGSCPGRSRAGAILSCHHCFRGRSAWCHRKCDLDHHPLAAGGGREVGALVSSGDSFLFKLLYLFFCLFAFFSIPSQVSLPLAKGQEP